jgi:PAS domain S-box-containing protein
MAGVDFRRAFDMHYQLLSDIGFVCSVGMTWMLRVDGNVRRSSVSDSKMVGRMMAHDWASTPLGPAPCWPSSLRAAVALMLDSRQPVAIGWGPDLIAIYNEAFAPVVAEYHPSAFGRPWAEVLAGVWERYRAAAAAVLAGEAQLIADQPQMLPGRPVRWFSLYLTPLRDDSGAVGGIHCAAVETTEKVEAAAALAASRDRLAREALDEMLGAAIELLGADKGSVRLLDGQGDVLALAAQRGFDAAFVARFQEVRLEDDDVGRALHAGQRIVIEDVHASPRFAAYLAGMPDVRALQTTPLLGRDGRLLGVLSTHFTAVHRPAEPDLQRLDLYARQAADFIERMRTDDALRASEERLRAIVDSAVDAIVIIDEHGVIQAVNPAGERMFGYAKAELIGRNVSVLMTDADSATHNGFVRAYVRTGRTKVIGIGREVETRRKDGSTFTGDLAVAEWQHAGRRYFTGTIRDVTERKRHEDEVRLLLYEVNHRAKNMLALVQAIARQTVARQPKDFIVRFEERIFALAASHDLLVKTEWKGADLDQLVRSQLAHFADLIDRRITLAGERVFISASAAQSIGMALHELATNAGKYGALSAEGRVDIDWRLTPDQAGDNSFVMSWREQGGPPVVPPSRTGFGTTVISRMAELSLAGKVELIYAPEGLVWRLSCPAQKVLEGAWTGTAGEAAAGTSRP